MKMLVIGRAERMGLGSMTEDFCRTFNPDTLVLLDVASRKGRLDPEGWAKQYFRVNRSMWNSHSVPERFLAGHDMVVGFETFYRDDLPQLARSMGVRSIIFPMWEWSDPKQVQQCHHAVCLSDTDYKWCCSIGYGDPISTHRVEWPAMHEPRPTTKDHWIKQHRYWPPRRFAHFAGNAVHNRDGTKEVLAAASRLIGTGAHLYVTSSFQLPREWQWDRNAPIVWGQPQDDRFKIYDGVDCYVCPRRLGGHSLPINEAQGLGIPTITLNLPDWSSSPHKVTAVHQPQQERFGPGLRDVWQADPDELGRLMRAIALGQIEQKPSPAPFTWGDFKQWWETHISCPSSHTKS